MPTHVAMFLVTHYQQYFNACPGLPFGYHSKFYVVEAMSLFATGGCHRACWCSAAESQERVSGRPPIAPFNPQCTAEAIGDDLLLICKVSHQIDLFY